MTMMKQIFVWLTEDLNLIEGEKIWLVLEIQETMKTLE